MEKVLSVHTINNTEEFSFNPSTYSRFKYGCVESTITLAEEMSKKFLAHDRLYNILDEKTEIVITPYAYRAIPSAATFLAENIKTILNWYFHNKGLKPVIQTKIHRQVVCEPDYGTLSHEQRKEILSKEKLSLNEDIVKNRFVLFVDDIRVTGAHERLIESMINTYPHTGHMHLYYAETISSVPATIEDTLNKCAIGDYTDLVNILHGRHYLSARMIKEILRMDTASIVKFYHSFAKNDLFINIVNQAIAEGYDKLDTFRNNFNYLKTIITDEFNKSKETTSN